MFVATSKQLLPHRVLPGGQVPPHTLALHVRVPPPPIAGHTRPHVPQLFAVVVMLTHVEPRRVLPPVQVPVQTPPWHEA